MTLKTNNVTYNIDKLPLEIVGMLNLLFNGAIDGFENAYMVEIKLDNPMEHIKNGGDNFLIHQSLDQYESHAKHLWDENWAVIHKKMFNLTVVDESRFETLIKKYLETGELSKQPEEKPQEVRRSRGRRL